MNQKTIIPTHIHYPRVFTSRLVHAQDGERWVLQQTLSDISLDEQLRRFVEGGAVITQISPPSIQVYSEAQGRLRVHHVGVSVLYVPASEGTADKERRADG